MKNIYILTILILSLIPLINAETYSQNSDVLISHPVRLNGAISPTASVNISIKDTTGNFIVLNQNMSFNASTLENQFSLSGGNTSKVGIYPYCITATSSGLNSTECFDDLEITASGFPRISSGEGLINLGALLIMFAVGIIGVMLFFKSESFGAKITFITVGSIFILMSILFSTVMVQQNLGGFGSILTGYDTFVFVTKSVVTVALLGFGIAIFLFMMKAWRIRRGRFED